jgi:hypothetical protein
MASQHARATPVLHSEASTFEPTVAASVLPSGPRGLCDTLRIRKGITTEMGKTMKVGHIRMESVTAVCARLSLSGIQSNATEPLLDGKWRRIV